MTTVHVLIYGPTKASEYAFELIDSAMRVGGFSSINKNLDEAVKANLENGSVCMETRPAKTRLCVVVVSLERSCVTTREYQITPGEHVETFVDCIAPEILKFLSTTKD